VTWQGAHAGHGGPADQRATVAAAEVEDCDPRASLQPWRDLPGIQRQPHYRGLSSQRGRLLQLREWGHAALPLKFCGGDHGRGRAAHEQQYARQEQPWPAPAAA
jgi:hypothetical protein